MTQIYYGLEIIWRYQNNF